MTKPLPKKLVAISALGMLTGCLSLSSLDSIQPTGDAFQDALANNYTVFAYDEELRRDWIDAEYFAEKALRAADGESIEPEKPEDWHIPTNLLGEFQAGREVLMDVVARGVIQRDPQVTAAAFIYYDCWLERAEDAVHLEETLACRDSYFTAAHYLTELLDYEKRKQERAEKKAMEKKKRQEATKKRAKARKAAAQRAAPAEVVTPPPHTPETVPTKPTPAGRTVVEAETKTPTTTEVQALQPAVAGNPNRVLFEAGATTLTEAAVAQLKTATADLVDAEFYVITVNGYAASDEESPLRTSVNRANAVRDALIAQGLVDNQIIVYGLGVPLDSTSESATKSRRVDLVIE